ncbi:hypothetical protein ACFV19_15570 [Streptomyces griseoluteus]|uniref:phosphotransferase-like protein n=1 Tax=Streptomyces griseoluteus TaxID=29306 RepID=UPI0036BE4292
MGNDLVVDHVLSEPWRLTDCLAVLPPEDVLFVGVHCPREELERRERPAVTGRRASPPCNLVHAHGDYDLGCDTSTASPRARAERIRDFLPHRPTPTAFSRLRARYSVE